MHQNTTHRIKYIDVHAVIVECSAIPKPSNCIFQTVEINKSDTRVIYKPKQNYYNKNFCHIYNMSYMSYIHIHIICHIYNMSYMFPLKIA